MAEAVALVASIVGLAGTGAKLALQLYTIADGIGSAGAEARSIAKEITLFSQSLTAVSKSLERDGNADMRLHEIAKAVVEAAEGLVTDLQCLVEDLRPKSTTTMASYVKRIKWVLKKSKVQMMRSSVESFKTTLILLVATIDSVQARQTHQSSSVM
jgi:hypothetical protein